MTPRQAFEQAEAMVAELKQARLDIDSAPSDIAGRAGLEAGLIARTECGVSQPRMTTIIRWADVLGYDLRLVKRL